MINLKNKPTVLRVLILLITLSACSARPPHSMVQTEIEFDGSIIQVSAQKMDQTNLAINALSLLTSANAASALAVINTSIVSASEKLAGLGASAKRLEVQSEFVVKLTDVLIDGVGNLVDADMGEESARLQALQVKQQLGIQAISIANAQPSSILGLFRG